MSKNYYSAREAAEKLQISRSSLYAYVSRGLIRSEAKVGHLRERLYLAADIDKLIQRKTVRKAPDEAALGALDWGLPVLDSAISQIQAGQIYYRGHELAECVRKFSLEETIALLWEQPDLSLCSSDSVASLSQIFRLIQPLEQSLKTQSLSWFERLQVMTPWLASQDLHALDLSVTGVQRSSEYLLLWIYALAVGSDVFKANASESLLEGFKEILPTKSQRELLRVLMIVCADHELNVSAFSARCVASARGTPHAALVAALAALSGGRHGGLSRRVESLFQTCEQAVSVQQGLKLWLQQAPGLPGFGHKLYPEGDPRWLCVKDCLLRHFSDATGLGLILEIADLGTAYTELLPSLDFALVSAARLLAPQQYSALDWFALGRLPGWLAHIQEQYQQPELIRPRARKGA